MKTALIVVGIIVLGINLIVTLACCKAAHEYDQIEKDSKNEK